VNRRLFAGALLWGAFAAVLPAEAPLTVTVLDVQLHGLAVVVRTPGGGTWLVDAALRPTGDKYPARDVIAPFLRAAGVRELAGIVASHPHGDHVGGLPYLFERFPVGQLVDPGFDGIGGEELETYRKVRVAYIAKGGKHVAVTQGAKIALAPALEAEVLWPPAGFYRPTPTTPDDSLYNANSMVVRIRHGAVVFLLPGDYTGMASLAKSLGPDKVKCTVLVAPHHGLNSSPAMAAATMPKLVVVSALEKYSGPSPAPIQLTRDAFVPVGAEVLDTPSRGHITIISDGTTIRTETSRKP
jgi:competence protein ComEC